MLELYLEECFATGERPCVEEAAARLGLSRFALLRRLAPVGGPCRYLRRRQIDRAVLLLDSTSLSIKEISYSAGFGSPATFYRTFRQFAGCTPSEWRS